MVNFKKALHVSRFAAEITDLAREARAQLEFDEDRFRFEVRRRARRNFTLWSIADAAEDPLNFGYERLLDPVEGEEPAYLLKTRTEVMFFFELWPGRRAFVRSEIGPVEATGLKHALEILKRSEIGDD